MSCELLHGDCLDLLRAMPDASVDLVFTSPPYEAARTIDVRESQVELTKRRLAEATGGAT